LWLLTGNMIYQFLKYLFKLTLESFFRVLRVRGHENIPDGPVIFVANHPSTLMDPVIIATILKRPVYFLAAAEFMGKGWVTIFMQKFINMIPVYRPDTLPGEAKKNADVFFKCFEHLGKDGSILIFPEGSSITQRKLRPLKTGTVRIALGAEEDTGKTINIVPIGLNYSNPHQFRSVCFVSIGKPINSKIKELIGYTEKELALKYTELVEDSLRENVIHLEDESVFELFEKVKKIVLHEQQTVSGKMPTQQKQFELGQQIQDAIAYYAKEYPITIQKLNLKLDHYIERILFYNLTDASIAKGNPKVKWSDCFKIIFGLPVFGFGFLSHAAPYYISSWFFGKMKVGDQFKGSMMLIIGLVLFLIWYIFIGVFFAHLFGAWWYGVIALMGLYVSGKFTLRYLGLVHTFNQLGNWKSVFKRDRNISESLKMERASIIADILAYDQKFQKLK
jgi:glycerol-3-phosphate O-acyltransferase/dihydroxyacetone phosphate acyltransferase